VVISPVTNTTPGLNGVNPSATGNQRPIFLSGVVMTDDGSPLPRDIDVLSVCGPLRRTMTHATSIGGFNFQWGSSSGIFGDASQAGRPLGNGAASLTGSRNGSRGLDPLANCDLMAATPGYSSSRVSLYNRAGQDNYDVGAIMIHLIASGEGHTVSVLALQAPKAAKKDFEKGTSLATSHKAAEALASFQNAVKVYPPYADAWLAIGKVQWELHQKEEARAAFQKAMDLDNKLVGPWQELGFLACDDSHWGDAVRYLDQAVRLDPMDSGTAWYFSALANYNLGHYDLAERAVRAEMKLEQGANPHANYLLGLVLIARHDPEGGADALRTYIAAAPTAPDVAAAKRELARVATSASNQ
jgi:tetratricopeptide (TPR) repeat protein